MPTTQSNPCYKIGPQISLPLPPLFTAFRMQVHFQSAVLQSWSVKLFRPHSLTTRDILPFDACCGFSDLNPYNAPDCGPRYCFHQSVLPDYSQIASRIFRFYTLLFHPLFTGAVWVLVPVAALSGRIRLSGFNHRFPQT